MQSENIQKSPKIYKTLYKKMFIKQKIFLNSSFSHGSF